LLSAALTLIGSFTYLSSAQAPADKTRQGDRKLTLKQFEGMLVEIREVRNLNKGDDWFRDLEIEVENVSDKPIYFISLELLFPDIPAAPPPPRADGIVYASSHTGFALRFGDHRLVDISELPAPEDTPLLPGQTHVFRIPEERVAGLESMKQRMGFSDAAVKHLELSLSVVNFGDGTGFLAGRRLNYPRHLLKHNPDRRRPKDQMSRKTRQPGVAQPSDSFDGCGSCSRMKIISGDPNIYCAWPPNTPPNVCLRNQAVTDANGSCITVGRADFDCGPPGVPATPCFHDTPILCSAEPDPTPPPSPAPTPTPAPTPPPDPCYLPPPGSNCIPGTVLDNRGMCCPIIGGGLETCADPPPAYECGHILPETNCPYTIYGFGSCYSPVLIDVEGNGFALTSAARGVRFDIDGNPDGVKEQVSWTAADSDDAWLALDRNGNGVIDSGRELFGNLTVQPASAERNGFIALAQYDKPENGGNSDGRIDSGDAIFPYLRLWRDANHDGVSQSAEMFAPSALNVSRLHLDYQESKKRDEHGNEFKYRAKVDGAKKSKVGRWAWDVFLVSAQGQGAQAQSRIRLRAFDQIARSGALSLPTVPFIKQPSACSLPTPRL
jgi:hypothetical protein